MIRKIAENHVFMNGDKKTAAVVAETQISENGVDRPPERVIWIVVNRVANRDLKEADEISRALQGL